MANFIGIQYLLLSTLHNGTHDIHCINKMAPWGRKHLLWAIKTRLTLHVHRHLQMHERRKVNWREINVHFWDIGVISTIFTEIILGASSALSANHLLPPRWAKPEGDGGHHSDGTLPIPVDCNHVWYGRVVTDVGCKHIVTTILATVMPNLSLSSLPGWARPEGEGGCHGDGILPNPINHNCMQLQFGVGGRGVIAAVVNPSLSRLLITGLCSCAPSLILSCSQLIWVASDENEQCTLAEEEESLGAEEALSCLCSMCYQIVDSDVDEHASESRGTGSGNGPPEIQSWAEKGKEWHCGIGPLRKTKRALMRAWNSWVSHVTLTMMPAARTAPLRLPCWFDGGLECWGWRQ